MSNFDLIEIYIDRFVNRTDIWGKQWIDYRLEPPEAQYAYQKPDMDTKGGRFTFEPVTLELVQRHFAGSVSCAWSAINLKGCSRWLCFDSDIDDGSLDRLESFLNSHGWHVIREGRRPGRAGHLWILFDKPVQADLLIILGDTMLALAGVKPISKKYPKGIERFPKSANRYSQVRAPLGINLKPEANGARSWFDGVEHNLQSQLEWLALQPLNRAEDATREALKHSPKQGNENFRRMSPSKQSGHFPILDYVQVRSESGSMVAQCPLCADEGHDRHQDNLKIRSDGSVFCCVFGGPNQVHKCRDIIAALKWKSPNIARFNSRK
jgi:hypothetical protein